MALSPQPKVTHRSAIDLLLPPLLPATVLSSIACHSAIFNSNTYTLRSSTPRCRLLPCLAFCCTLLSFCFAFSLPVPLSPSEPVASGAESVGVCYPCYSKRSTGSSLHQDEPWFGALGFDAPFATFPLLL
ncbi:hypothetical protein OPV22_014253 [Ensete ventricosum]|uniref:Uncharacterized protein n=1 Tax=Ensete ventricosum TaxID=4639 RepID=A0AAV8QXB9_ENSVE|nr:hypothetical protein OPV22_014253 [Ensete ventricosum]